MGSTQQRKSQLVTRTVSSGICCRAILNYNKDANVAFWLSHLPYNLGAIGRWLNFRASPVFLM